MDGDPRSSSLVTPTIKGLVAGRDNVVNDYQAAGQQKGVNGATTERWAVSLVMQHELSDKYSRAAHGIGAWAAQRAVCKATSASAVLSLLAIGPPSGTPPMSFVDGASPTDVPEPATSALMLAGCGGADVVHRRRARRPSPPDPSHDGADAPVG